MSWNVPIAHKTTNTQHHGKDKEGCDEHADYNGVVHNLLVSMYNHGVKKANCEKRSLSRTHCGIMDISRKQGNPGSEICEQTRARTPTLDGIAR